MGSESAKLFKEIQDQTGSKRSISPELWHACAGPLVSLPQIGSLVYYFPQGHSEQVAVSTKRTACFQSPSYPNLPPQLICQVNNVTLHVDKDTDEVYAQMSLRPVNSDKDVLATPDFGLGPSKHPSEFFCKTLTASDTSTHGGFSVPRRAADKLFPLLDYSAQPPTQELVVRDLQGNTWKFRHIYRGQPKRHLLTTGWSLFIGSKRLKAGDSVLFIRDEMSQLMVGVRRANRQQATLPSSVLSADSMHIGVLAAAAQAAANNSSFTIFYNPRACPSDFVIPFVKYQKSVLGAQLSVGMRFGMMFETEDSGKRRVMGTIVGISDLDHLRWPHSAWRNLQVEWDEPGCNDKPPRVSAWEIETPESLFIFPSLTSGLKRPLHAGLFETEWGNMIKRPLNSVPENNNMIFPYSVPNLYPDHLINMMLESQVNQSAIFASTLHQNLSSLTNQNQEKVTESVEYSSKYPFCVNQPGLLNTVNTVNSKFEPELSTEPVSELTTIYNDENFPTSTLIGSQSSSGMLREAIDPTPSHDNIWDHPLNNLRLASQVSYFPQFNESYASGNYSCLDVEGKSNTPGILDECCAVKEVITADLPDPSSYNLLGNYYTSSQDVQSQITSSSLADLSKKSMPNNSGGTASSNADFDESSLLPSNSWQQVAHRVRTYTKVQRAGSVGRSIDVTSFKNYNELGSAIESMFGLQGLLTDPKGSGWKLVYVDYENDVLLVGDDPWEEFVGCVRCIRILSPAEVQSMSEEGMKLLNSAAAMQEAINGSVAN